MFQIISYVCLCFVLIYMTHSIYNHFKNQFTQKKNKNIQLEVQKQNISIPIEKNENIHEIQNKEELNKMKAYFQSLK